MRREHQEGRTVRVIAGKDRGKEGRVVRVLPADGRVMVDGVVVREEAPAHRGRRTSAGTQLQQGGIIDVETFIDISNVQVVCRSCNQPTRVVARPSRTHEDPGLRRCEAEL